MFAEARQVFSYNISKHFSNSISQMSTPNALSPLVCNQNKNMCLDILAFKINSIPHFFPPTVYSHF